MEKRNKKIESLGYFGSVKEFFIKRKEKQFHIDKYKKKTLINSYLLASQTKLLHNIRQYQCSTSRNSIITMYQDLPIFCQCIINKLANFWKKSYNIFSRYVRYIQCQISKCWIIELWSNKMCFFILEKNRKKQSRRKKQKHKIDSKIAYQLKHSTFDKFSLTRLKQNKCSYYLQFNKQ